jgi:hypothetical protein
MSEPTTSGQVSRRDVLRDTLSINVEIMFRALKLSKADRIRAIAAQGFTAYSFWNAGETDRPSMLEAQKETGLACVSLVGTVPVKSSAKAFGC